MGAFLNLPQIPEDERTPLVEILLKIIEKQSEQITKQSEQITKQSEQITKQSEQIAKQSEDLQKLKDEIAVLKGNKPKPKIPKSKIENPEKKKKDDEEKRAGSAKREKTKDIPVHDIQVLQPSEVPSGSIFKGYQDYIVQGLRISSRNIKYRRARYSTPDGSDIIAELPDCVSGHFDSELKSFIHFQYFSCRVTQPLLLEQLREFGVDISSGQLNNILIENVDDFRSEKESILKVGLEVSSYVQTDDTGARNKGKNGYTNCIGNDFFTYFTSSDSKSRINFLEILRAGHTDYILDESALSYMKQSKLSKSVINKISNSNSRTFETKDEWEAYLESEKIENKRHQQVMTEAALLSSAFKHGLSKEMVLLSDDAGQFNILKHALCWVHAERTINKLIGYNDDNRNALNNVRDQIWNLYKSLKAYRDNPSEEFKCEIEELFGKIFQQKTCYESLNIALSRLYKNKDELLLVLDYPFVPLHNNACETDIREMVTKRKVSGGTQSLMGRCARDTFLSLKQTCRKLGLSFWKYLNDRHARAKNIPSLFEIILSKADVTI